MTNHYQAVNVGQLKALARPFMERLIGADLADVYPWLEAVQTNDYGAATIGQAKHLFSFELP